MLDFLYAFKTLGISLHVLQIDAAGTAPPPVFGRMRTTHLFVELLCIDVSQCTFTDVLRVRSHLITAVRRLSNGVVWTRI